MPDIIDLYLQCAGAAPLSAADRAARELEEFTMRNHADVDPNAPPRHEGIPVSVWGRRRSVFASLLVRPAHIILAFFVHHAGFVQKADATRVQRCLKQPLSAPQLLYLAVVLGGSRSAITDCVAVQRCLKRRQQRGIPSQTLLMRTWRTPRSILPGRAGLMRSLKRNLPSLSTRCALLLFGLHPCLHVL